MLRGLGACELGVVIRKAGNLESRTKRQHVVTKIAYGHQVPDGIHGVRKIGGSWMNFDGPKPVAETYKGENKWH